MKFKIKNFGNIKEAEIELKNLTVFVGENNTNKTWTAYLIYAFFSNRILEYSLTKIWENIVEDKYKYLDKFIEDLNLTNLIIGNNLENFIVKSYKLQMQFLKEILNEVIPIKIKKSFYVDIFLDNQIINEERKKYHILMKEFNSILELIDKYQEENFLLKKNQIIKELINFIRKFYPEPFNIPSERKAIIQFANLITLGEKNINELRSLILELLKTEGSKINLQEILQKFNVDSFQYNYPKPVIDFKDFVSRLSLLKEKDNSLNKELLRLFENSILEGKIHIDQTGKLIYHMNNQNDLDVSISSSMVKSLSGIDIYLKYRAEKNGLVIIDEPEMNLHPEAQVKLIEFLTIMANKGIKILITTHSPYIVDHLINLIEGYYSKKKDKEKLFWQPKYIKSGSYNLIKPSDIFISKDDVSVYFFRKDGVVEDILDREERTIDWRTFSQISERISNIYWEL